MPNNQRILQFFRLYPVLLGKELIVPLNYLLAFLIGVIINYFQGLEIFGSYVPFIVPIIVQSISKASVKYGNRENDLLVKLPKERLEPAFVMDRGGHIVASDGITKLFLEKHKVGNIYDIFDNDEEREILQKKMIKCCKEKGFIVVEICSTKFNRWFKVNIKFEPLSNLMLVWLDDISTRKGLDKRITSIRNFSSQMMHSLHKQLEHRDSYDRLAQFVLEEGYQGVFIAEVLANGDLQGHVYKKINNDALQKSDLITINKDSEAPILQSRKIKGLVSDQVDNYLNYREFLKRYPFHNEVISFFGFSITNFINYHDKDISFIAFNKKDAIQSHDHILAEAIVNTAYTLTTIIKYQLKITGVDTGLGRLPPNRIAESMALFARLNPDPVFRFDAHGKLLDTNPATDKIFGREIEGENVKVVFPEFSSLDIEDLITNNKQIPLQVNIGNRFFRFMVRGVSSLSVCQVYGSEITDRVLTQQKLESVALFARLNPEPVFRFSPDGQILETNPATDKIIGSQMKGCYVHELITEFKKINYLDIVNSNVQRPIKVKIKDRYFRFMVRGIADLNVCQVYGSDVTDSVLAQHKIESMALFARLNPEPVLRIDKFAKVLQSNPAANEAFGGESIHGDDLTAYLPELATLDIKNFIASNQIKQLEQILNGRVYRFILRGLSNHQAVQLYGSDITERVEAQKKIEQQNQNITASIRYAKRIQDAILPSDNYIKKVLPQSFVFYLPRDIVSGDFYWVDRVQGRTFVVVADCTGHGVPGALMSMLGVSNLNEIVNKCSELPAGEILNQLRKAILNTLASKGHADESKDGMDISLLIMEEGSSEWQFSGAFNHLILIRAGELIKIKADRMPIGKHPNDHKSFTTHNLTVQSGDCFYMFSDGFKDQFGGFNNRKYNAGPFSEFLLANSHLPMPMQLQALKTEFENYKGTERQLDDVLVMGLKNI